ncbi:MAG: ubiquinone biosynthesis protein [Kofleriaceae bacterium]|nr:ubiquinone biosynthesis protein [Kofleriaceae bacterium]MCB9572059.1 ubiquinone biosynthesis protein [Kofleriaceae bacterium]
MLTSTSQASSSTRAPAPSLRARLHTVADATRAALADPDDTQQAFRIADALSFDNPQRMLRRFRRTDSGARLLARRDDLLAVLTDRPRLEAMPEGSLAHAYLRFLDGEGITAAGLVQASLDGVGATAADVDARDPVAYVRTRMRDTHDLWHTVTGYRGDLLGEAALLAFTFAQTGNLGVGFLAGIGVVLGGVPGARRFIAQGYARGRRATWMPPVDWVKLLPRPLDEVRRDLGITELPVYEPVRTHAVPADAWPS